jgi:hypothetical protein
MDLSPILLTFTEDLKNVCYATPKSEKFYSTQRHSNSECFFMHVLYNLHCSLGKNLNISFDMVLMKNQCSASFPGDAPEGPSHLGAGEVGNTGRK